MKIAVIVDHDVDLLNGASRQSCQFVDWLVGHGHDVHLIFPAPRRRRESPKAGLRIYSVPSFSVPSYREYRIPLPPLAPTLWLRRWKIDLVHAETMNPTLLLLGYWMIRRSRKPMFNVLTTNLPYYAPILLPRDNAARKLVFRAGKAMMNAISNRIDGTFILSEGMRERLTRDFYAIDQGKVFPLIRPMDPAGFAARNEPSGIDGRLAIRRGCRLVTLSRLCQTKNVDFLVKAFARRIYPKNPSLHLIVAGEGPREESLRGLSAGLGCPNIHFPGRVPFGAVPAFLREADFFLCASLSEAFGNIVCEAKYAGVPVIALDDKGGVRAQIIDRRTGFLVSPADEEEFGRRFFELFDDPGLQQEIRRQAREDVLVNHSPDKIYANLLAIYGRAVRGEKPDAREIGRAFAYDRSFLGSVISPDRRQS